MLLMASMHSIFFYLGWKTIKAQLNICAFLFPHLFGTVICINFPKWCRFCSFWYYLELNCIKFIIKISKVDTETAPSNGPIWDEEQRITLALNQTSTIFNVLLAFFKIKIKCSFSVHFSWKNTFQNIYEYIMRRKGFI